MATPNVELNGKPLEDCTREELIAELRSIAAEAEIAEQQEQDASMMMLSDIMRRYTKQEVM